MKVNQAQSKNQDLKFPSQTSKHSNDEQEGESNHYCGGHPGDGIEDGAIRMVHHQFFIIDEQEHEYENKGEDHSIDDL